MFFFFFQAEDGIRDSSVTGVQTCALPILDGQGNFDPPPEDLHRTNRSCPAHPPAERAWQTAAPTAPTHHRQPDFRGDDTCPSLRRRCGRTCGWRAREPGPSAASVKECGDATASIHL